MNLNIEVVGGGPAGLYFAILMKRHHPGHRIRIWERNPRDNTFGWGVVFSEKTLEGLREPDPPTYQALMQAMRSWENVDIVHRDQLLSVAGNRFSGVARIALLEALYRRCEELGIELHFGHDLQHFDELRRADLVVGADGVNSRLRQRYRQRFQPQLELGRNRYIWFGTRQPFGGLTLIFRPQGDRLFMAHAYKYSQDLSTFIVEVDETTWNQIRSWPSAQVPERLARVFAPDLGGQSLLSNRSRWIRFTYVQNQHWWADNMVLLGDSLHTAHFSIGSGTKLALEDSLALWRAFEEHPRVAEALPAFEAARRPPVERFQTAALTSQRWFETARVRLHLEPIPFAYEAMTRSSRVDDQVLRKKDPAFAARYDRWQAEHGGD